MHHHLTTCKRTDYMLNILDIPGVRGVEPGARAVAGLCREACVIGRRQHDTTRPSKLNDNLRTCCVRAVAHSSAASVVQNRGFGECDICMQFQGCACGSGITFPQESGRSGASREDSAFEDIDRWVKPAHRNGVNVEDPVST